MGQNPLTRLVGKISANILLTAGIIIVAGCLAIAIAAPLLAPHDLSPNPALRLLKPFREASFPLGTDAIGRDILTRLMYGIRTSVLIAFSSVVLAALIGTVVGVLSGFSNPGLFDTILMRLTDVQMGFPFVVLAMIALTLFNPDKTSIAIVLSLSLWPVYARMVRSSVMLQKDSDYIAAARLMGAGRWRIYTRYVGRNLLPAMLPLFPLDIAGMVINESLLSYMSIGIKPPEISIGNIMADARGYIASDSWYILLPGVLLVIMVLGLNFIGDSLQTLLDPSLRQKRRG
ncbi:MAG: ABC transporter permease [Gracilibacteraceae bacterium]|jgi:ABC-type dipeptide/oligopeptide/nickel transport system permease subunit|nr:ABC transporter permease [Gracilibacteraceae bacterium]